MSNIVERHHPAFRALQPIERGCGRFSAEEIRRLVPQDLRKIGCPESVFLRILEGNARADRSYVPSEEELRAKAEEQRRIIEADAAKHRKEVRPVVPVRLNASVAWEA